MYLVWCRLVWNGRLRKKRKQNCYGILSQKSKRIVLINTKSFLNILWGAQPKIFFWTFWALEMGSDKYCKLSTKIWHLTCILNISLCVVVSSWQKSYCIVYTISVLKYQLFAVSVARNLAFLKSLWYPIQ